jgi:hypothetical protein
MHAQYISYWIELGQLVVVNTGCKRCEKLERLAKIIPKLILSWQDLESTYPIRNLIRLILSERKKDICRKVAEEAARNDGIANGLKKMDNETLCIAVTRP